MIIAPELSAVSFVRHGFFTRRGGVSADIYASLNCGPGSGDDPANVAENRARAQQKFYPGAAGLCTLRQVHGAKVVVADAFWNTPPEADAVVTATPGLAIGVLTADCVPVLFASPRSRIVGAAHAGWRGASAGVLERTVAAMAELGAEPSSLIAAIGPHIGRNSYEVGPEFKINLLKESAGNEHLFAAAAKPGHHLFDIGGYVRGRLERSGVKTVASLNRDTLSDPMNFFSYRRATLAGEPDYGRQLSAICLLPE